ncbi:MAG: FO synthase subunit 2 [Promethearchaeota archaeon]|nr:MAG: FO synthase subunit 2 [Candidatus Lokiarchaeota archaeon]
MSDIENILRIKTDLLCRGLYLSKSLLSHYKTQGISIDFGRKGGAGPLGGRYFLLADNETLVNVALWDKKQRTPYTLGEKKGSFFEILNGQEDSLFTKLKLIPNPKYYSPQYKTSDGVEMKRIALVHGVDCLGTTIYQKCKYWECGEACKFCGIELSLQYDTTIVEKSAQQISEVITVAKKEGRCSHMTITSGTEASEDKGALRYTNILRGLKQNHPDIPLHIQIEPLDNLNYLNQLKEAGADTIGIHIEVLTDELRKRITPGKASIPYSSFVKSWKHAINTFGANQVESFVLMGFGEPHEIFMNKIEEMISLGIIPFITPVRSIPLKHSITPPTNPDDLLRVYYKTAELMKEYGVNPLKNKAGCVRCGGCSAINESFKAI